MPDTVWQIELVDIFASRYTYVIPNKDELIAQGEAVLREWHEPEADGYCTKYKPHTPTCRKFKASQK